MRLLILCLMLLPLCAMLSPARAESLEPLPLKEFEDIQHRFYQNPLDITSIGDPFILPAEGKYYLFATKGDTKFEGYFTETLAEWSRIDKFTAMQRAPFGAIKHWAPEAYYYNGRYTLLFSCVKSGNPEDYHHVLGIAFSDTPQGPYICPGEPLLDLGYSTIDASLFVDDDGTPYLFYSRDCSQNIVNGRKESHTYGVQLSSDLLAIVDEPVLLIQPSQEWEMCSENPLWNEGGIVRRHNGTYYLYYSANLYSSKEYGVGVATATSPLGPYTKADTNPLLTWQADSDGNVLVSGPGHNGFFTVGEETFTSYHVHTFLTNPTGNRQLAYDRSGYHADGTAFICGPTTKSWQLLPLQDIGLKNGMAAANGPALLMDGDICASPASKNHIWHDQTAEFTWDVPIVSDMIQIYPADGFVGTGILVVNDQYQTTLDFSACKDVPGSSVILPLAEDLEITSLCIQLDGEGALGEVMVTAK